MEALERELSARGLTVSSIPGKGRGLLAAKHFAPGDVIIYQEPYASSPSKSSIGSSSCDGCFASANLRKCSRCRIATYCGSACQITGRIFLFKSWNSPGMSLIALSFCYCYDGLSCLLGQTASDKLFSCIHQPHQKISHLLFALKTEWKLHQLECQALSSLSGDRKKMLTPTIRLMVRLILKRKLQNDWVIQRTATDDFNLVAGLVSHMSDLDEEQLVLYAQMANLVKVVLPAVEVDLREITENFSRLSCNAHTICDDELRPLGIGLYPVISIINHSCIPNSVLVFEGRIAFVRAVEPIHNGDEILISYIETAATTKTRQNDLKQYFFSCGCPLCTKNPLEELKENAILEGYRCKDQKCFGFLFHDTAKKNFTCQQCGLVRDEYNIESTANEVEEISTNAAAFLSTGNPSEASLLYRNVVQLETKLFHPCSIKLLRTRETLLKILMELNDWRGALTYCQLTIPVYQRLYPSIHPMLGLQYYTCGKLEWLLEQTEDALKSFTKAVEVLRVTHGTSTPFIKELFSRLDEARAEDSYKRSA